MIKNKTCASCGVAFRCGETEADKSCWCSALPHVVPVTEGAECLCPVCLKEKIKKIEHVISASKSAE